MPTEAIPGYEGQLYLNGTLFMELTDVTLKITADKIDTSSHTSGGWKSAIGGLKAWQISIEGWYLAANVAHLAARSALVNGTPVSVDLRPKDQAGKEKVTGTCRVLDWEWGASQSDAQGESLELEGDGPPTFGII